jgi:hypothetical protein
MSDEVKALVKEYHETRSIAAACDACDLLYKEMQEGEKNDEESDSY